MAIQADALRRWALDPDLDDEAEEVVDEESTEDEADGELEEGPRNALWAGEDERESLAELEAEEVEELLSWLEENEPEVFTAVGAVADALVEGDEVALDAAVEALKGAEQFLNPEYPELTAEQRELASENIAKHMKAKGKLEGGREQAIAIGLAQARKGESA